MSIHTTRGAVAACALGAAMSLVTAVAVVATRGTDEPRAVTLDPASAAPTTATPAADPDPTPSPSAAPTSSPTPTASPSSAEIAAELRAAFARLGPTRVVSRRTVIQPISYLHAPGPGDPTEETRVYETELTRFPDGSFAMVERYGNPSLNWRAVVTTRADRTRGVDVEHVDATDRTETTRRQGLPFGKPDTASRTAPNDALAAFVRARLAADAVRATATQWHGRPAWTVDVPVIYSMYGGVGGDTATVTFDRETGLVVDVVERERDNRRVVEHDEVLELTPSSEAPPALDPAGQSEHWRRGSYDDAARELQYRPARPLRLPAGFEADGIAYLAQPEARLVQLRYRYGAATALVTMRNKDLPRSTGDADGDPFPYGGYGGEAGDHPDAERFRPEPVHLTGGDYAGTRAEIVIHPRLPQHLWFATDEHIVTISGDLTRAELLAGANSLRRS